MNNRWIEPSIFLGLSAVALIEGLKIILRYQTTIGSNLAGGYLILLGVILGILTLYTSLKGSVEHRPPQKAGHGQGRVPRQVVICLLILAGSSLLIPWLGYLLSTVLFFLVYFRLLGGYRWVSALLMSTSISITLAYVFVTAGMMLPQGPIPWP